MNIQEFDIVEHNKKPHFLLEDEIQKQKDGLFTFTLRVAENKIVDVLFLSYGTYEKAKESDFSLNR